MQEIEGPLTNQPVAEYAGFWRRSAAYMIDSFIIAFVTNEFWLNVYYQLRIMPFKDGPGLGKYERLDLYAGIAMMVITIPFVWMYFSGMESSPLKATLGKLAVGIYVTDLTGQRISFGRATGRFFGKLLSGALLSIGYLMAGFTARKQALHDLMAECLVLRK